MTGHSKVFLALIALTLFFSACTTETPIVDSSNDTITQSQFNSTSLISFNKVACTLDNGSSTTCYEIKFSSNPVANGPYCPATINDVGGLGIYDGPTNPGFQVMKAALFNAMENDGYDIVDANGNIRIDDFNSGPPTPGFAYCLDAAENNNLELTFLIPVTPEDLSTPNTIETVELVGLSLYGVPINGAPPSVTTGPMGNGNIPSLDPCGGHHDPAGYYHWHFLAEAMNEVLTANSITDVSCTNIPQSASALIGFAKDGYPIYSYSDAAGVPNDLDQCNGHFGVTPEYPDGIYHYHASRTAAPNIPPCLKGASVPNAFSYQ